MRQRYLSSMTDLVAAIVDGLGGESVVTTDEVRAALATMRGEWGRYEDIDEETLDALKASVERVVGLCGPTCSPQEE